MVNIRDVAQAAGVSPATASNVLGGRGTHSQATINKVRAVAAELGYERPRTAGIDSGIGIRIHRGVKDPVTGLIGRERLKQRAREHGIDMTHEVLSMLTYADENMPEPAPR